MLRSAYVCSISPCRRHNPAGLQKQGLLLRTRARGTVLLQRRPTADADDTVKLRESKLHWQELHSSARASRNSQKCRNRFSGSCIFAQTVGLPFLALTMHLYAAFCLCLLHFTVSPAQSGWVAEAGPATAHPRPRYRTITTQTDRGCRRYGEITRIEAPLARAA